MKAGSDTKEILRHYLEHRNWPVKEEELSFWASKMVPGQAAKGEFLLREGEQCGYIWFVVEGCLRLFSVDAKGKEHTLQFAPELWWLSDLESFGKKIPAKMNVDALEPARFLRITAEDQHEVLQSVPSLGLLFRGLLENRQGAMQKRMLETLSASAEERYEQFLKTYPSLAKRLPLHIIASWIGITPESLSRIRKKI